MRTGGGGGHPKPGGGGDGGGTSGDDTLTGTSGDDTLSGLGGNDTISGLDGHDTLSGGDGNDVVIGGAGGDTIDGGAGDDQIYSELFSEPRSSLPQVLDHGTDLDTMSGGDGSDTIYAGYGDTVDGGADGSWGDSLYISFQGAPTGIHFDTHSTTQTIGGATITGIETIGWIEGGNYDDYIDVGANTIIEYPRFTQAYGMGGNDTLISGEFTSLLDGGDGNDILDGTDGGFLGELDGGAGNDTIYAPTGSNFNAANGGDGDDTIYSSDESHGGAGNDSINLENGYYDPIATGDAGDDVITGSQGRDVIQGNNDNDVLTGEGGNDTIDGGAGTDVISGGTGNDTLTGGSDGDTFRYGQGDGHDTITDFDSGDVLQVSGYTSAQSITQAGSDVIASFTDADQITFENTDVATVEASLQVAAPTNDIITGGSGDDQLFGYGGDDTVSGLAGNDTLAGNAGADAIDGGEGNDTLFAGDASQYDYYGNITPTLDTGSEQDTLSGGTGDDTIFAGYGDNVDGGDAVDYGDTLYISFQAASSGVHFDGHLASQAIGGGTLTGIENIAWIEGSDYDDYLDAGSTGHARSGHIYGMGGNDTLIGGQFTSFMDGGDGNDTVDGRNCQFAILNGGAGNDVIFSSAENVATVDGGDGSDTIHAVGTIHGGTGDDVIQITRFYSTALVSGDDGNDKITGNFFADQIDGGAGNDSIDGGEGADTLTGGTGDDALVGGLGYDYIDGGAGNDIIDGGTEDDVLVSGGGNDTLTGGAGADTFIVGDGNSIVTDFVAGEKLGIQASFSADTIQQVDNDVVITLESGNVITFQNADAATIKAAVQAVHVNDVAISADGSTVYGTGDEGTLYVYSGETGDLLQAWHIGNDLGGMDISPDGSFAVVTELQPLSSSIDENNDTHSTAAVYKIDLATGQVTTYTATLSGNRAFHDAEVLDNGQVLLTLNAAAPLKTLDLSSGAFADVSPILAEDRSSYSQDSTLIGSADGSHVLVGEWAISDAALGLYSSGTGVTAYHGNYEDDVFGYNFGVQAYSETAGLIAQGLDSQINIYNGDLQYQFELGELDPQLVNGGVAGLAFDSSGQYLFVLNTHDDAIYQVSASDWSVVGEFAVGADIFRTDSAFGNRLLVAPDMSYFTVMSDDGALIRVDAGGTPQPTDGDDTLIGGYSNDTIDGLGGNDVINGLAGDDMLHGSAGDDSIAGGVGSDVLDGGEGNDTLYSDDTVVRDSAADQDVLTGGAGNDVIWGGYGDSVDGGDGRDSLILNLSGAPSGVALDTNDLGAFSDATIQNVEIVAELHGTEFADALVIGTNADDSFVTGGGGDDHIVSNAYFAYIEGGAGADSIDVTGDRTGIDGGDGADIITATGNSDEISGGAGDDLITLGGGRVDGIAAYAFGNDGNDTIILNGSYLDASGGSGDDTFFSSGSRNSIVGGDGLDTVDYSTAAAAVSVNLSTGTGAGADRLGSVEIIIGSAFADTLTGMTITTC